jgi:hypothetical protein
MRTELSHDPVTRRFVTSPSEVEELELNGAQDTELQPRESFLKYLIFLERKQRIINYIK